MKTATDKAKNQQTTKDTKKMRKMIYRTPQKKRRKKVRRLKAKHKTK